MNKNVNLHVTNLMVSTMIDECIIETINENQKSKFDNDFTFYKSVSDLHKRIKIAYDETERRDNNDKSMPSKW